MTTPALIFNPDAPLYIKQFGCQKITRESNRQIHYLIHQEIFQVTLALRNNASDFKLHHSLVSGQLFYDLGSDYQEPIDPVRIGKSDPNALELVEAPWVDPEGKYMELKIRSLVYKENRLFRIKFAIHQPATKRDTVIWGPLIQILTKRQLNQQRPKKRKHGSQNQESENQNSDLLKVIKKQMVAQEKVILQNFEDLRSQIADHSLSIQRTESLATGIFIEGGLKLATRRLVESFEATSEIDQSQMIEIFRDLEFEHPGTLQDLHHCLGEALKPPRGANPLANLFDKFSAPTIDPKDLFNSTFNLFNNSSSDLN